MVHHKPKPSFHPFRLTGKIAKIFSLKKNQYVILKFFLIVITGCTKGIGLCYAKELAKRNMNLVLIARKVDLLNDIADEIRNQYQVKVEVIIAKFGEESFIYTNIEERLADKDIGILVNNVGVANEGLKYFHDETIEKMWNMINVNIGAMTLMSKIVLPRMEAKKKGAIINVSSAASFSPNPFLTMYSATKAYVNFFSRGTVLCD